MGNQVAFQMDESPNPPEKKTSKQTNKLHPKESQQQNQIRMNTTATPEGEEGLAVVCRERPELSPLL